MRAPPQMLQEVITNTIYIDNAINEIIRWFFNIQPSWGDPISADEEGELEFKLLNKSEIEMFDRFFLQELGSSSRLGLIKEIINNQSNIKISLPDNFDHKLLDFYKIRNIFAHSLYPKNINKKEIPNYVPSETKWEELHLKHTALFKELNDFLVNQLYNALLLSEEIVYSTQE